MKNIVTLENNDLVVTIKDIAKYSGNDIKSVKRLLTDNEEKFDELGLKVKESKAILNQLDKLKLNQEQSMFLFILMRNSPQIVEFKFNLVKQFMMLKDMVCETKQAQLDTLSSEKNQALKQLSISQRETKDAKRKNHAYPRNGGFETVTRIIEDYGVNITPHDLNQLLVKVGVLRVEVVEVNHYKSLQMSGIIPLVHTDTVIKILDGEKIQRGVGYSDNHPAFKELR